ncbi:hypothetical protein GCM10023107_78110 [Actinoplanes octamycinicus]|uniref:phosphodiester glycosidase family protein n=1 Tax=Actinoplanes octamycinicus TaxID=135948 RepID=UPI0031EEFE36
MALSHPLLAASRWRRTAVVMLPVLLASGAAAPTPAAAAVTAIGVTGTTTLAPGLRQSTVTGSGSARPVHVVEADLSTPTLQVQYLSPPSVGEKQDVKVMATNAKSVAAINGDFWDPRDEAISTNAPDGASIKNGQLRGARARSAGYNDVASFVSNGTGTLARLAQIYLQASVTPEGHAAFSADQLNSPYLIPNGVGIYNDLWSSANRSRTVEKATSWLEVVISGGKVTRRSERNATLGGAVQPGSIVLVGTGTGIDRLNDLTVGAAVTVNYRPVEQNNEQVPQQPPTAAQVVLGAHPDYILLVDGAPAPKPITNTTTRARTALGFSADGRKIWLVAADGDESTGATFAQMREIMLGLGADDAISLDGGGSTTMVTRASGTSTLSAISSSGENPLRKVPNGLGLTSTARSTDCTGPASIFAAKPDGSLTLYQLTQPSTTTTTWSSSVIGAGWNQFGRVLAGPGGRVYGINSGGLYQYVWRGETDRWKYPAGSLGTQFAMYADAAWRDKITVDRQGDFYRIDSAGNLVWSRLDENTSTWPINQTIDGDWGQYDLLIAADAGVLFARAAADGKFYRYRFDTNTRTWVTKRQQLGAGWQQFTRGVVSPAATPCSACRRTATSCSTGSGSGTTRGRSPAGTSAMAGSSSPT